MMVEHRRSGLGQRYLKGTCEVAGMKGPPWGRCWVISRSALAAVYVEASLYKG